MVIDITDSNFKEYIDSDKLSILDFYADWCQPCKNLAPVIEEISNEFKDIVVGKCNIEENDDLITKYGIRNIPTLIFSKNGETLHRITGTKSPDQLKSKVKELL